jgi:hypothetical protein
MILQLANVWYVELQDESFNWLVGLNFPLGWTEVEATMHSFPINFKQKLDEIFGGLFSYHRMLEYCNYSALLFLTDKKIISNMAVVSR